MPVVGELSVKIEANARQFRNELREANRRLGRLETNATKRTAAVGASFKGLAKTVAGVAAAIGAIQLGRGIIALGRSAVQTSASFEQFGVRLRGLLGSQGAANRALETFIDLSSRTPFAVQEIVSGATTLGAVALNNRERLEELTFVASNLAAITGLSFSQTAENLQRSLSAGIASADLFRQRAVTGLLESVAKIPDATKLSTDELLDAFRTLAGESGKFGTAAEELSLTLGGALSNIGDASGRFKAELGDALAPGVIATAREVFIPFFDALRERIEANSGSIEQGFIDAIAGAIGTVGSFAESLGLILTALDSVGLGVARFGAIIGLVFNAIQVAVNTLLLGLQSGAAGVQSVTLLVRRGLNAIGALSDAELAEAETKFDETLSGLAKSSKDFRKGIDQDSEDIFGLLKVLGQPLGEDKVAVGLVNLGDKFETLKERVEAAGAAIRKRRAELAAATEEGGPAAPAAREDPAAVAAREKAVEKLIDLEAKLALDRARATEPLVAQFLELQNQITATGELIAAGADRERGERIIAGLVEDQADLATRLNELRAQEPGIAADLNIALGKLRTIDKERADAIRAAVAARIAEAVGIEAITKAQLEGLNEVLELLRESQDELAGPFEQAATDGLTRGIRAAIEGEAFNFADTLANLSENLLTNALKRSVEEAGKSFDKLIGDVADGLAGIGGEGGIFSKIFGGEGGREALQGILGVGAAFLTSALRGTQEEVETGLARTAVTSTQQVRGIVAGPSQIAVAQVGPAIRDAFVETNLELRRQTAILTSIDRQGRGGTLSTVDGEASEESELILAGTSPSFV